MFLYKDQKFHAHGICFELPDNFFIHSSSEAGFETCIEIESIDHSYSVSVGIIDSDGGTEQELQFLLSDDSGRTPLGPITPITIAGFSGHCLKYHSSRWEYYEIRLSVEDDVQFYLYISAKEGSGIDDIVESPEMVWILQHIERSDL